MSTRTWWLAVVIGVWIVGGCERKEENRSVPSAVPTAASTPAAVEGPADAVSEAAPTPAEESPFQPADAKDDPAFSSLFPGSDRIGGWIKTAPVIGGDARRLPAMLPNYAQVLMPFPVQSVAMAKYERMHGGKAQSVTVYLVRAATADDAYGMLSVSCPGLDQIRAGEIRRQERPEKVFAAKGPYFGIFSGQTAGEDKQGLVEGLELLAGKVLFEFSERSEPPKIVQYLQNEQLPAASVLFIRSLESLRGPAGREMMAAIGMTNTKGLNKILRLGPTVDFAVAVFTNKDWPGPDVIWLAKYPSRESATAAARDYRGFLNRSKWTDMLVSNTLIKGPRGRFLLGTWTMETESLTSPHLMNQIQAYLP